MTIEIQNKLPRSRSMKSIAGFTLLELMIVVVIIAILAGLAYPSYLQYAYRAHRADGKEMLMRVAAAQERYFTNFNHYATNMGADLAFTAPTCGAVGDSEQCYYNVTIGGLGAGNQTYTLTATAQGAQANDKCGNLSLLNTGEKNFSGGESNGKCW